MTTIYSWNNFVGFVLFSFSLCPREHLGTVNIISPYSLLSSKINMIVVIVP